MKRKRIQTKKVIDQEDQNKLESQAEEKQFPGYPSYAPGDDIYINNKETDLDPENISKVKETNERQQYPGEIDFNKNVAGTDLDVPGSELDDQQENIGSEDEENNYYSVGGDNHNNLEEDKSN